MFIDQAHINAPTFSENDVLCSTCMSAKKKHALSPISAFGHMLHPGNIPKCLQGLTIMEKRLISKIQVFMTIIILPGGQYAEKGLAIDFPVNITRVNSIFPIQYSDCNLFTISKGDHQEPKPTHFVRRSKVLDALIWLKENNLLYENTTLVNEDSLEGPEQVLTDDVLDDIEEVSMVPTDFCDPDIPLQSLINGNEPRIKLPRCDTEPVFAYDLDGGEESAFPHLFPYGKMATLKKELYI